MAETYKYQMRQTINELNILTLPLGAFSVNAYLVWTDPDKCLLIDPADDAEIIEEAITMTGLRLSCILVTHGHMDHLSALASLCSKWRLPVFLHPADRSWAFSASNQMPPYYGIPAEPDCDWISAEEGQDLPETPLCRYLHTPGHSPGSVCFHFHGHDILFSGDTLFKDSIGRTDLSGSDNNAMLNSLRKLAALPGTTTIFPGHGQSTVLACELQDNPFLQQCI